MASTFSKLRDDVADDLENQVSVLRREVSSLKKTLSKRGASALDDTRDNAAELYDDVMARVHEAMPHIARQSRAVKQAARDNPIAATVVGIAVVGLLIGLLVRR